MNRENFLQDGKLVAVVVSAMFCMAMTATCKTTTKADAVMIDPVPVTQEIEVEVTPVINKTEPEETVTEEIPDDGFVAFDIPNEMEQAGGEFPETMQRFVWKTCNEQGVPYSLVVAMIEIESSYQPDAISSCGAVGYMQIVEKWHHDRMAKYGLDCADDPQANIIVGVDFMAELLDQYTEEQALIVYNCGSVVADSTSYSRAILQRKAELEKEFDL